MSGNQDSGVGADLPSAVKENVYRLIYRSHSRMPDEDAAKALADILRVSRANNASCGVTGALMLYGKWFAQVLEGPEDEVRRTFDRISVDGRHYHIDIREDGMVAARAFSRWAMANVGEYGQADSPMLPVKSGMGEGAQWSVAEGAQWKVTPEQEPVLATLRELARDYA